MSRLKHPRKTKITNLSHKAALIIPIHLQTSISRTLELLQVTVGNGKGDFLATNPVTSVIAVAVDEGDFYALVEDVG